MPCWTGTALAQSSFTRHPSLVGYEAQENARPAHARGDTLVHLELDHESRVAALELNDELKPSGEKLGGLTPMCAAGPPWAITW